MKPERMRSGSLADAARLICAIVAPCPMDLALLQGSARFIQ